MKGEATSKNCSRGTPTTCKKTLHTERAVEQNLAGQSAWPHQSALTLSRRLDKATFMILKNNTYFYSFCLSWKK